MKGNAYFELGPGLAVFKASHIPHHPIELFAQVRDRPTGAQREMRLDQSPLIIGQITTGHATVLPPTHTCERKVTESVWTP